MENSFDEDTLRKPDDPLPDDAVLRLYSMRMCPYAQRARLMLTAKGVKYDRINIDLNNKPDWFFDLNPYGEVPVIIHEGNRIYESLICSEYIEDAFPSPHMYSTDPAKRAWQKIYYNHWTKKGIPAFYSLLKCGCLDPDQSKRFTGNIDTMNDFLKKAKSTYFSGETVGFSDFMIWPWFERLGMLEDVTGYKLDHDKFSHIFKWIDKMRLNKAVQVCQIDEALLVKHYSKYRTGNPDFTIGAKDNHDPVTEILENLDGMRDPKTRFKQS